MWNPFKERVIVRRVGTSGSAKTEVVFVRRGRWMVHVPTSRVGVFMKLVDLPTYVETPHPLGVPFPLPPGHKGWEEGDDVANLKIDYGTQLGAEWHPQDWDTGLRVGDEIVSFADLRRARIKEIPPSRRCDVPTMLKMGYLL